MANPGLTKLNWSIMPEISKETQVNNGMVDGNGKKGEVVGGVWVTEENVAVVKELETRS